ncbi:MAG: hypothetical protein ACREJB_07495 [Planctomycetaceae bacterium]
MEKVTVDAAIGSQFESSADRVEICDKTGRTLGYFLPPSLYREWLYAWAKTQFSDDEELERVRREPGGLTTREAVDYLEQLAQSHGPES